jgi:hypothetical protein
MSYLPPAGVPHSSQRLRKQAPRIMVTTLLLIGGGCLVAQAAPRAARSGRHTQQRRSSAVGVISGCVEAGNGELAVLDGRSRCPGGERSIALLTLSTSSAAQVRNRRPKAAPAGTGALRGPSGARGATGARGVSGPTGPAGVTGATGATGPAGPAGTPGSPGPTGPTGQEGPPGVAAAFGATLTPGKEVAIEGSSEAAPASVLSLALPAGSFVVQAKVDLVMYSTEAGGTGVAQCKLTDALTGQSASLAEDRSLTAGAMAVPYFYVYVFNNTVPLMLVLQAERSSTVTLGCWAAMASGKGTFRANAQRAAIAAIQATRIG